MTMKYRPMHLKESHWGIASKLTYLEKGMRMLTRPPTQLFFHGQGSDRAGFALEKAQNFSFYPYKIDPKVCTMYMFGNDALDAVPGAIYTFPPAPMPPDPCK
jgi:hypothetical protein